MEDMEQLNGIYASKQLAERWNGITLAATRLGLDPDALAAANKDGELVFRMVEALRRCKRAVPVASKEWIIARDALALLPEKK